MQINIIKTSAIISILFLVKIGFACSCSSGYLTFVKNIRPHQVIFAAQVIEHIELPNPERQFLGYGYYGLTKLVVFKWYQNKMKSDTIYYLNGSGGMCIESIDEYNIGEKLIIKANKSYFQLDAAYALNKDERITEFIKPYIGKYFVEYEICDTSKLQYFRNKVIGNITINFQNRRWKRAKLIQRVSKKRAEKLQNKLLNGPKKFQKMNYRAFNKLMKRKCTPL